MAPAKKPASSSLLVASLLLLTPTILPVAAKSSPIANERCGAKFIYPPDQNDIFEFYRLDTINVTYISTYSNPTLYVYCGAPNSTPSESECDPGPSPVSTTYLVVQLPSALGWAVIHREAPPLLPFKPKKDGDILLWFISV